MSVWHRSCHITTLGPGVQALLGFWLMMPLPICLPAVALCRFSKHNTVARTVINTSAAFLSILMLSPLYDTYAMHKAKENASHATPESLVET
jgi:predicted transporter